MRHEIVERLDIGAEIREYVLRSIQAYATGSLLPGYDQDAILALVKLDLLREYPEYDVFLGITPENKLNVTVLERKGYKFKPQRARTAYVVLHHAPRRHLTLVPPVAAVESTPVADGQLYLSVDYASGEDETTVALIEKCDDGTMRVYGTTSDLEQYQNDVVAFAKEVLQLKLTSSQESTLRSMAKGELVFQGRRVGRNYNRAVYERWLKATQMR